MSLPVVVVQPGLSDAVRLRCGSVRHLGKELFHGRGDNFLRDVHTEKLREMAGMERARTSVPGIIILNIFQNGYLQK